MSNELFKIALERCSGMDFILFSKIHGDFAKEQCLIKPDKKIVFIDWNLKEDIIIRDLINFFREEINFLKNKHILKILEKYPSHVLNNFKEYLIIEELLFLCQNPHRISLAKKRIEKILKEF